MSKDGTPAPCALCPAPFHLGICHLTFIWNLDFDICHLNSLYYHILTILVILSKRVYTLQHREAVRYDHFESQDNEKQ